MMIKKTVCLLCAGSIVFLTACTTASEETVLTETEPTTESVVEQVTESEPAEETISETISASDTDITGIWKKEDDSEYIWLREDGKYVSMLYQISFPDDVIPEQNGTQLFFYAADDSSMLVYQLEQAGSHPFDTMDGLYDIIYYHPDFFPSLDASMYQVFVMGNKLYLYKTSSLQYQFDGMYILFTDSESDLTYDVPCLVKGDTMMICYEDSESEYFLNLENTSYIRNHDLDDFLLQEE